MLGFLPGGEMLAMAEGSLLPDKQIKGSSGSKEENLVNAARPAGVTCSEEERLAGLIALPLPAPAREALPFLPKEEFCFCTKGAVAREDSMGSRYFWLGVAGDALLRECRRVSEAGLCSLHAVHPCLPYCYSLLPPASSIPAPTMGFSWFCHEVIQNWALRTSSSVCKTFYSLSNPFNSLPPPTPFFIFSLSKGSHHKYQRHIGEATWLFCHSLLARCPFPFPQPPLYLLGFVSLQRPSLFKLQALWEQRLQFWGVHWLPPSCATSHN